MIRAKRVYEVPADTDGRRILVERLWPRGIRNEDLHADAWLADVAPSTALRKWFGHRPELWEEFRRRYRRELNANRDAWSPILDASRQGTVTLLYSAHDTDHNSAVVLLEFLGEQGQMHGPVSRQTARRSSSPRQPSTRPRAGR
jgi:uncharacterized protein YeaO (DUF488 family)